MADQWYFAWGQNKLGPYTSAEMRVLAASGRLQPQDTVWKEGVDAGVAASRIKNLFHGRDVGSTRTDVSVPPPRELTVKHEAPPSPTPDDALPIDESIPSDADLSLAEFLNGEPLHKDDSEQGPETPSPATLPVETQSLADSRLKEKDRKGIVISASGAIVVSQDGRTVQFRKKCRKCGHEDTTRSTLPIRNGTTRGIFFCPKCKKPSDVEIRGKL